MKYRLYIDEVGNPDLNSSDDYNHRFLSLTGIIIDLEYVRNTLNPEMERLKSKYFDSHPDEPLILHRKELVNSKPPFHRLRDEEIRKAFDKDLLNKLRSWEYVVITVCIDKKYHKETYNVWRYEPYHYCLTLLVERFVMFLEQSNAVGDVMSESRNGKEDRKLKDSFCRLYSSGPNIYYQKE